MRHTGRALAAVAALAVLSVTVTACGGGAGATPPPTPQHSGAAGITGVVRSVDAGSPENTVSLLVVADPSSSSIADKALIAVTPDTLVWARAGDAVAKLPATDLAVGQRVAVRFSGPVAESYPVQGTAADVEVLSPLP